eukprot:TRINITY_DN47647_c0_g1_i1.p1 TRINITY_DN47647_c0_g1~~TRINITY_DN47647_c0_g1_i1.p1  ORF type:complete len:226 (+),score=40.90 TRINITY_DN47647_c0_g1_i1:74-751(+)
MAVDLSRLGLPGGRTATCRLSAHEVGAERVRESIAEALRGATGVQRAPLPAAKKRVRATLPDDSAEGAGGARMMRVTLAEGSQLVEVVPEAAQGGSSEASCYEVGSAAAEKLYRTLMTEFALRDHLGGHLPSAFSLRPEGDDAQRGPGGDEERAAAAGDASAENRIAALASVQCRIAALEMAQRAAAECVDSPSDSGNESGASSATPPSEEPRQGGTRDEAPHVP